MRAALALITIGTLFLLGASPVLALDPSLDISQYAHTAWTVREGFSQGNIYAIAQTPDGYLWLGGEFGLFRFDGIRTVRWQPPQGRRFLKTMREQYGQARWRLPQDDSAQYEAAVRNSIGKVLAEPFGHCMKTEQVICGPRRSPDFGE